MVKNEKKENNDFKTIYYFSSIFIFKFFRTTQELSSRQTNYTNELQEQEDDED